MAYVKGTDTSKISTKIDKETNSITWTIPELKAGETLSVQYTLTLKDSFDETIIDKILNTNQKVDINYKDFDGKTQTKTSDVSPKIKLTKIPQEEPPKKDDTISKEELPKTGATTVFVGFVICSAIATTIFAIKSKKSDF